MRTSFAGPRPIRSLLCRTGICLTVAGLLTVPTVPSEPEPATTSGPFNLLVNPGFEEGRKPWFAHSSGAWGDFEVVEGVAHDGRRSARLTVQSPAGKTGPASKIFGVIAEVEPAHFPDPGRFPEVLSGWYFVENWDKDHPETDLYLQVVVIIWGDPQASRLVGRTNPLAAGSNYQIRYYLDGLEEPPFLLRNAKIEFVKKGQPRAGEWIHFTIPLAADFERLWGAAPTRYDKLEVLFEARWDNRPEDSGCDAVIYYDDLFLGWKENPQ